MSINWGNVPEPKRGELHLVRFLRQKYERRPITEDMTRDVLGDEIDRLNRIIERALLRVLHDPDLVHDHTLAMADDLIDAGYKRTPETDAHPDAYE